MHYLNLQHIERSLRAVQQEFPKINEVIQSRRDSMTDEVVENMLSGYRFIDTMLYIGVDLLDLKHVKGLLELNHIVLCGTDPEARLEHRKHIEATEERFYHQD